MSPSTEVTNTLASLALFADLSMPELQATAHTFEEESVADGQRILRQGFTGGGFYVILEGEAIVHVDGAERARLRRGDFFGEVSILLGGPPVADVIAAGPLRCLVLPGAELSDYLLSNPTVMLRMLQTMARRLSSSAPERS